MKSIAFTILLCWIFVSVMQDDTGNTPKNQMAVAYYPEKKELKTPTKSNEDCKIIEAKKQSAEINEKLDIILKTINKQKSN